MFIDWLKTLFIHLYKGRDLIDRFFYLFSHHQTFLRYSIVGVSNTVIDFGLFFILTRLVEIDMLVANPISVEIAIIWSFTWNNLWTFSKRKVSKPFIKRFIVFQFVSLGSLILSQNVLFILNNIIGLSDLFSKASTIPIVLVFNYLVNSRWTFRDTSHGKSMRYLYIAYILLFFVLYLVLITYTP